MTEPVSPNPDNSGSITILYQQYRQGHPDALRRLIDRFRPRLLALANSTLRGRVRSIADAEDALQNALLSFWKCVDQGEFEHEMDRDDLWSILGLFTVRKAIKLRESEHAKKRGNGNLILGGSLEDVSGPSHDVDGDLVCNELLELLDRDLRSVAFLRLSGNTNQQISDELDWSIRTVERKLNLIRALWQREIDKWNS